jgi:hypothetical protein
VQSLDVKELEQKKWALAALGRYLSSILTLVVKDEIWT